MNEERVQNAVMKQCLDFLIACSPKSEQMFAEWLAMIGKSTGNVVQWNASMQVDEDCVECIKVKFSVVMDNELSCILSFHIATKAEIYE